MTTVVVLSAGVSQPSSTRLLGDRLAEAVQHRLRASGDTVQLEVVELREYARDLANHVVTGFPSASLKALLADVADADAIVAVTPIFSASYSGLFKMFFDVLDPTALVGTPVLIAATGGTARHSLALDHALRPLFAYLRAIVVPTGVFAASEDWASEGELRARIDRAAEELAVLLGLAAPRPVTRDVFADVVPFDRLLAHSSNAPRRGPSAASATASVAHTADGSGRV